MNEKYLGLAKKALEMRKNAYVPYSHYRVGAAILTESGKVYTGCNIENASFGATICAERTAAVKAVSEGETRFSAIAIAGGKNGEFAYPCGICRQFLSEFSDASMPVIVIDEDENTAETTLGALLPEMFKLKNN